MKTTSVQIILAIVCLIAISGGAQTTAFTYQGRLNLSGNAANGLYEITFSLYDRATNGNQIGTAITLAPLPVTNGFFTAALDFGAGAFTGADRWLEISVTVFGTDQPVATLQPRQPATPTPYALYAASAGGLLALGGERAFRIESGSSAPNIIGGASGNSVYPFVSGATIAGGGTANFYGQPGFNYIETDFGTIGGGMSNSIWNTSPGATIAGGIQNTVEWEGVYSTIAGGYLNTIIDDAGSATISGGRENKVLNYAGTVAGGWGNQAAAYASVGGGQNNVATGDFSVIGGGADNSSIGEDNVVGGGRNNWASGSNTTVAGGRDNGAGGNGATVGGGRGNSATEEHSTIAGGYYNRLHGEYGTIGGGEANEVEGYQATVGGGFGNTITPWGEGATIPGGVRNRAEGYGSFAAGSDAHALHNGCFVWADGAFSQVPFAQVRPFPSITNNEFAVRATGGVRFVTAVDTNGAPTAGVELGSGAGTWANLSDRNAKENFVPTDPREILEKVAALSVATWNYKTQDQSVRHIGPTPQDFHTAFGLGENDRTITTVDADGVGLAAIQGLNQKVQALEKELAEMKELVRRLTKD